MLEDVVVEKFLVEIDERGVRVFSHDRVESLLCEWNTSIESDGAVAKGAEGDCYGNLSDDIVGDLMVGENLQRVCP